MRTFTRERRCVNVLVDVSGGGVVIRMSRLRANTGVGGKRAGLVLIVAGDGPVAFCRRIRADRLRRAVCLALRTAEQIGPAGGLLDGIAGRPFTGAWLRPTEAIFGRPCR